MIELSLVFGVPYSILRHQISAYDFQLYKIFTRLYGPIGTRREDYRMAMIIAHQCGKRDDAIEKFLPKFDYTVVEENDEPETVEETYNKCMRIAKEIAEKVSGSIQQGAITKISFKPGELRRIKKDVNNGESGGRS